MSSISRVTIAELAQMDEVDSIRTATSPEFRSIEEIRPTPTGFAVLFSDGSYLAARADTKVDLRVWS